MTGEDSAAVWTVCPRGYSLNPVAIKLLASGLLTGHICYVHLFLHLNRFCICILYVPC